MSFNLPNIPATQLNNNVAGNYTNTEYHDYDSQVPIRSQFGDFTPFYITIAISTVILGSIIIFNIVCCCSRYSEYWLDRHTGNRWLVSIWSASPHKQPPLDLTELTVEYEPVYTVHPVPHADSHEHLEPSFTGSLSQQPLHSQEYLELQKRESEI